MGQHAAASAWQAQLLEEVKDLNFSIVRISQVQPTTVQVRYFKEIFLYKGICLIICAETVQDVDANQRIHPNADLSQYLSNCRHTLMMRERNLRMNPI